MLFECLHKFCQTYLNDILIYNKTLKEHKTHVKEVLDKLREVNLQIDINKCEFKIQKISFLKLLIFINDLRMNSWKVDVIRSWKVSWSLIYMQIFIDFCNFYQWFIKNFSKIVWLMIKLTRKCYDPSYAPMLVAMLVAMLMTIAGRSPLGYRVVPRPTLFRVSLCSPESYR